MIFHSTSKKPILLVGNGVRTAGAVEAIREFAAKTDIPVLTTMNAVDIIQGDDSFGFIGTYGSRVASRMLAECDLLVSIGARLGLRQIGKDPAKFAPNAHLIRIDIDQYELARKIKPNEEDYLIDALDFMESLLDEDIPSYSDWKRECIAIRDVLAGIDDVVGNLAIKAISSLLPPDAVVAVDVGQNQCWAAQSLTLKGTTGRILIAGGYGSMGCGLPFAIGAAFAEKGRPIFCITGDGGLQMNIQELEAIVRDELPIKTFVLNNRVLGKISEIQQKSYGKRFAQTTNTSGYTVPDFEKVARAYGMRAATFDSYEELQGYREWLDDDGPCLFNILLPEDTLLIPKLDFSSMEVKPALSDDIEAQIESICLRLS